MNPKHIGSVFALLLVGTSFAGSLVVGKGNPQTLEGGNYAYDLIELHDDLTLEPNAIVTMTDSAHADTIFMGSGAGELPVLTIVGQSQVKCTAGKAGCLCIGGSGEAGSGGFGRVIIDGGSESSPSPQLRLFYLKVTEGATVPSDDNTILRLGKSTQKGQLLIGLHGVQNFNAQPIGIQFAGGYISSSEGASDYWFGGAAGSTIVLESVGKEPIRFLNAGHGSRDFKDGNVHLKFVGAGDFRPYPASSIASGKTAADFSIILGGISADYDWSDFSGNINIEKGVLVAQGENVLPCAASCGILTSMDADAWFDIRADQAINGIDTEGVITNGTKKASAVVLTVGSAKDGVVRVGEIDQLFTFRQTGHTVTVDTAFVPNYDLADGTLLVTNNVVVSNLTLAAGTTVRVDGGILAFSGEFSDNGATIQCVNGGLFGRLCSAESGATSGAYLDGVSSAGLIKTGAGTFMVNQRNALTASVLDVREGVLKLSGVGSTNEWWRVTVNASGYRMNLAAIGLFADDTLDSVLDGHAYSQATDVARLARGQIYYDTEMYTYEKTGMTSAAAPENDPVTFSKDAAVLLDSDPKTGMTLQKIGASNPDGIAFTFRRADGEDVPVTAYSLRYPINASQNTHTYAARSPNKYVIETSADVVDWMKVGEVGSRGEGTWGSWTDNRSFQLDLPAGRDVPGAKGLVPGVSVRVAEGATLDCSNVADGVELSALTVDLALGGGTIRNVRLATTGRLDLIHLPASTKLGGYEIPLTFASSVTTGDLSGWTLRVNGAEVNRTLVWKDGKLTICSAGMAIILR